MVPQSESTAGEVVKRLDELKKLAEAATPGEWHPGHLANDEHPCGCRYIMSENYCGSICTISVDNGLSISEGGNDAPPLEEAKANCRYIAAANPATVLDLLALIDAQSRAIEAARAALEPFAEFAAHIAKEHPGWDHDGFVINVTLTNGCNLPRLAAFRAAAAAIAALTKGDV